MSEILEILERDDRRRERKLLLTLVQSEKDMDLLYEVVRENDNRQGSYASWVYTNGSDRFKDHVLQFHDDLITRLPNYETQGILRSMLRSVALNKAPKNHESKWIDLCFQYLSKVEYEVAVKVHSMQILYLYCLRYPELIPELEMVVLEGEEIYTPALRARSRNILKSLAKIQ